MRAALHPAVLPLGVAGSVLVTTGGYCYARLPHQTWMDRVTWLWSVRASPHHVALGVGLAGVGLLLMTWAWWDLRREVRDDPAGLTRVRRATALWALPLLVAPPLFSGDGWSYVATGDLAGRGLSPYAWTPAALPVPLRSGVSPAWLFTPSPYGPLPLAWGGAWSHLTHDPWLLLTGYRLAAVLGLVLVAWAMPVLAVRAGRDPVGASAVVVASPFALVHGVGGLHNDVLMAGLVLTALVLTRVDRWWVGAVLVGVATAVKAPAAAAAVGVVLLSLPPGARWLGRLRRSALVGAVVTGVVLATGWVTGLGTGWIGALSVPDREHTVLALTSVLGRLVRSWLVLAGPPGIRAVHDVHPELLAKRLGLALLVVVAAWVLMRTRLSSPRQALTGAAVVLTATVVLSPAVHYWYFLWCVPLLACLPWRRAGQAALVATVVTLGLTAPADRALHVPWLWTGSAWALLLVPLGTWVVVRLRTRGGASVEDPGVSATGSM